MPPTFCHRRDAWTGRGRALVLVLLVWVGVGPARAESQNDTCRGCHDVALPPEPHGGFGCQGCHTDVDLAIHPAGPAPARPGSDACGACHDTHPALTESVHAGLECVDCHGPAHEIGPLSRASSPLSPLRQIETCGACHQQPPELLAGYLAGVHARGLLRAGLVNAPSCSSCHGAHDILPPTDPRSETSRARIPETCGACHRYLADGWVADSTHGRLWKSGDAAVPVCSTCHTSHGIPRPTDARQRFRLPETCGDCHGALYTSYRDSFHGNVTDLGLVTAAICSDCHTPHHNLPADDPASSVHPANLPRTCGTCHGTVNASFTSFDPHADPRDPDRQPWVHLTWLFMTGLLFAVFGFFAVHDLLWLQRSLVGLVRGEFGAAREHGAPYVTRFSRFDVGLHAVVAGSFFLLAATGLPLKFHSTAWARSLIDFFGGVTSAGLLHRIAALVTFGYAVVHLGDLFRRIVLRREKGLLWGRRSLVPQPGDVADLLRNLRYFFYLGPRPRFDRWTYWEKFDYFAVFWGVMIIGVSGLMLWFPGFFTSFLPGWTLNAAFVVHSDEALLAAGFIFLFHFFHTHMRPESFPMDPVIFLGRMPLARFREERPLEYQAMVERGELEKHLVEAPSDSQVRRAYFVGFAALFIGLGLAAAMLWSLVGYGPPS